MLATTNHTFLHFSKKLQYNFFSIFPIPDKQSKGFNFIQKKKTVKFLIKQLNILSMYIYSILNMYSYWFLVTYKNNFKIKTNTSIIARVGEANHFSVNNTNLIDTQALVLNNSLKCLSYIKNYTLFYNIFQLKLKPNFTFFPNWHTQNFKLQNTNKELVQVNSFLSTFFNKINFIFIYTLKFIWFFKKKLFFKNNIYLKKYRFKPKKLYFGNYKFISFLNKYYRMNLNFKKKQKSFIFFKKISLFRKNLKKTYALWKTVSSQNKSLKQKFFNLLKTQSTSQKLGINQRNIFSVSSLNKNSFFILQKNKIYFNTKFTFYLCNTQTILLFLLNPWLLKMTFIAQKLNLYLFNKIIKLKCISSKNLFYSNLIPSVDFNMFFLKKISSLFITHKIREDFIPYYYHTLIRFFEHCSGKKFLLQIYPFINQNIQYNYIVRYKIWINRMKSYERRLGHKFFFEEALHIMHISFKLKDSSLFSTWLKAIILRISFWKTRVIFRFLRYLFLIYFQHTFNELKIKGLKIKLKGKISVAGNSRKRTILYKIGQTSHSSLDLRISHTKTTVTTFTGVMGFQVWLFY